MTAPGPVMERLPLHRLPTPALCAFCHQTVSTTVRGAISLVSQRRKSKQAQIYLAKAAQGKGLSHDTNPGLSFQSLRCAIRLGKLGPDGSCSKESTQNPHP